MIAVAGDLRGEPDGVFVGGDLQHFCMAFPSFCVSYHDPCWQWDSMVCDVIGYTAC